MQLKTNQSKTMAYNRGASITNKKTNAKCRNGL